jgi:hypothetical protein
MSVMTGSIPEIIIQNGAIIHEQVVKVQNHFSVQSL